jgi:hypothetical protein
VDNTITAEKSSSAFLFMLGISLEKLRSDDRSRNGSNANQGHCEQHTVFNCSDSRVAK